MNTNSKRTAVLIVSLIFVIFYGFVRIHIIDMLMHTQEVKVSGFLIQFEDGTTEPEVKDILGNYSIKLNYSKDCNAENGGYKYYIKVHKDNLSNVVKDGLRKDENWTDSLPSYFIEGDYFIYPVTEQAIHDENFIEVLKRHNLHVKTFVWCLIKYTDNSRSYVLGKNCITWSDAVEVKSELETNEKVLSIMILDLKK